MENKTKILAFAAVALMFAVCFIGFVAISDGEVDADEGTTSDSSTPTVDKGPLGDMCPEGMTYKDGKYTLTKNVTVNLTADVSMEDVKFVGGFNLTIKSNSAEKPCTLKVTYNFEDKTGGDAGRIFQVSSFVLENASLNVVQLDGKKTIEANQPGGSVFGEAQVTVKGKSTMTITTNENANRIFYNNNSSLSIIGENAKVILDKASSLTASLHMTDGATLEIVDPINTAGNFYPNITGGKITVTGAANGNHGLFFYGSKSNAVSAENGIIKNCTVESDGIVGFYSHKSVDATGSTFKAKELVVAKSIAAKTANVKGATFDVTKVGALNPDGYKPVNDRGLQLDGVTFNGNTVIDSGASLVVEEGKTLTIAEGATVSVFGTIDSKGTIVNNGTIVVKDAAGLKTAVAAGGKISLADNIELDERIKVENKAVSIDLNGKTITAARTLVSHGGVILVHNEGELTIDDTSVNKTGGIDVYSETLDESGLAHIWGAIAVYPVNGHTAKLTVNAGEYKANYYAIVGSGNCTTEDRIEITINDGKFESPDGYGMYLPHVGITTINKGTFIAKDCAIEIRAGELSIKDGQFKSTATEFSCNPNGNGTTTSGAVIAIAQHTTKKDITVNISGGVFEGLRALNESNPQNNDSALCVKLSVTGGTFKGMIQSVDSIDFITGGSFSDLSGLAYVASGATYNLVDDCTVDSNIIVKAGTTLNIAKDVTLTTKGTITNEGVIDNKGTITNEGVITTVAGGINISGKLIMGDGSKLTVGENNIIDGLEIKDGAILAINTNSKGGFDATLNGKATASKLDVWINDTFTVAKGAKLTMTGTFSNAGNVTIDGTLLMTDAGKLQVTNNGIVTINGTIDGGIIDITEVDKDIVCVLLKPNSTITSKIDGTDEGKTSIVVLFGIKAGKGGVSVTKGSVIVDGALVEGDVTVPSGSTSFVYGTLEPGATLTIENNAAVNPTGSGSLVVESGAKVVTNSGASIKSVTYKAGSELNGITFDTDTRVTPEGNVLVAIKIYLNYDDKKLNVSADYVEAFAGDKYVDVLSGVTVSGVNSRITFSGWYNSLDEKITSDVVVPSGGADVILTAHFTEKAKNTVINTGSNDGVDYSVVIAFIVLIGSMVFLCSVLRKR
ncbi:hypothetical protein [Candidatus Methanarcanum hacksteinii]|uniref:hypothetical protein n=1 Tax=Candidatus Methanarcanum hacksteinii TaxID=2911857 RepID=UPI0037DDB7BC